ncbi:MAG: replication-associated recombination protein A [Chlamydiota bacterium]
MRLSPLSEKMRPQHLHDVEGQDHLLSKHGLLTKIIENKRPLSILLWGPPGCGKTTIARLYASAFELKYHNISPMHQGTAELKKLLDERKERPLLSSQPLILFVDEIHRFNKAQQDLFLPYMEDGSIILIGATTENPSFALNSALLSRLRVLTLNPLSEKSLENILVRCLKQFPTLVLSEEIKQALIHLSQADGRHLCNLLENCLTSTDTPITLQELETLLQRKAPLYDTSQDGHYGLISALHKTIRGSDPQAALYYLARMLQAGEDPLFIGRRLIRIASEDIGLADPEALNVALQTWQAFERLGMPEGELALAQCVIYLALAPKSNKVYTAYNLAKEHAAKTAHFPPPPSILNAPTQFMKNLGYGKNYQYDHDAPESFSGQSYFPIGIEPQSYYEPLEKGFERELVKRLRYFENLKKSKS